MKSLINKKTKVVKKAAKTTAQCCAKTSKNTPGCHD